MNKLKNQQDMFIGDYLFIVITNIYQIHANNFDNKWTQKQNFFLFTYFQKNTEYFFLYVHFVDCNLSVH